MGDVVHARIRRAQLLHKYRRRRERYEKICQATGLEYSWAQSVKAIRQRLAQRNWSPVMRRLGEIHTFAVIPRYGWHHHLYDEMRHLGPVTEFDYRALGYDLFRDFSRGTEQGRRRRREMNGKLLTALADAHARDRVDWVFIYGHGVEISRSTVERILEEHGLPTVNMCLDDKQSWEGMWMGDHRAGQVDIASAFDVSWTSARVACSWYLAEGARPLYLPEGCNPAIYRPLDVSQDIDVSFIGMAYGFRREVIEFLRRHGIAVAVFGDGWRTRAVWGRDAVEVMCRSRINLGMGGIGYAEGLTNVKTRDFEVPCTGGGVYLTSFNPDLALHFEVGREILCYRSRDELVELIRYYLARPEESRTIADRARRRALAEHRWLHRFAKLCRVLGVLCEENDTT
jgi:hypothetical protein